jgi:hypothetical protein
MSDIFVTAPGTMVAIPTNQPQGIIFDFGPVQTTGVVVSFVADGSVAAQFQPSLDGAVYVMPFGDNIGNMVIDVLLNSQCTSGGSAPQDNVSNFLTVYQEQRLSQTNTDPIVLIIGQKAFVGFATGFTLTGSSENGNMIRGQLKFVSWMST